MFAPVASDSAAAPCTPATAPGTKLPSVHTVVEPSWTIKPADSTRYEALHIVVNVPPPPTTPTTPTTDNDDDDHNHHDSDNVNDDDDDDNDDDNDCTNVAIILPRCNVTITMPPLAPPP